MPTAPSAPEPNGASDGGGPPPSSRQGLQAAVRKRAPAAGEDRLENDVNLFAKQRGSDSARASLAYLVAFVLVLGGIVYALVAR